MCAIVCGRYVHMHNVQLFSIARKEHFRPLLNANFVLPPQVTPPEECGSEASVPSIQLQGTIVWPPPSPRPARVWFHMGGVRGYSPQRTQRLWQPAASRPARRSSLGPVSWPHAQWREEAEKNRNGRDDLHLFFNFENLKCLRWCSKCFVPIAFLFDNSQGFGALGTNVGWGQFFSDYAYYKSLCLCEWVEVTWKKCGFRYYFCLGLSPWNTNDFRIWV